MLLMPPAHRIRTFLRALLVLLMMAGLGLTLANLVSASRPPASQASVVLTLDEDPQRGYGAARLRLDDESVSLAERSKVTATLRDQLKDADSNTCLLRVAPGVSQGNVHDVRGIIQSLTGQDWRIQIVLVDDDSTEQD